MRRPLMWIQSVTLVLPRMNQKMGDVLINMKLMLARRRPIWGYILVREKWQLRIGTSPILYWSTSIKTYSLTYQVKSAFSENFDNYYTIASITYVIIFIITTTTGCPKKNWDFVQFWVFRLGRNVFRGKK